MKPRRIQVALLVAIITLSVCKTGAAIPCATAVGWLGRALGLSQNQEVLAPVKFYNWIHFEFGAPGYPDRIVMRSGGGWFKKGVEKVLYQGTVLRIPLLDRQRLPKTLEKSVTTYTHSFSDDYPENSFTVTTAEGVFILHMVAPGAGGGYWNYLGGPTLTTFFVPQEKPWKYVANARIGYLGAYRDDSEYQDTTRFASPYVIVVLREADEDRGYTPSEIRQIVSSFESDGDGGYKPTVPLYRLGSWLVRADRPPGKNFEDALFYRYGGKAIYIGPGDYTGAQAVFHDSTLVLTPRRYKDVINMEDPEQRPPVRLDLSAM